MQLNFSELALSPQLEANLARHGFAEATPVQAQSIPPALEGRDVVATAQTGTGKTLAFALPVIESLIRREAGRGIAAVIMSPTRELALQIDETVSKLIAGTPLKSVVAVGGLNERPQLNAIRKGAQILIATPGRLCDFLQRRLVRLDAVTQVVLDEADRMLDMGFLPSIEQILKAIPEQRQTLFFSATIEPSVAHLIEKHLKDPARITIGSVTKPAEHVRLHLYRIEQDRKVDLLRHMLNEEEGSFLVFAKTKHGTERLAKRLVQSSVKAAAIHGDRSQNQRNQALRGFQTGYYRVLVATDVAARGIHVDNIAHVVNFDLPMAPEDFIHRVGRTGRAGAMGTATTFVSAGEHGAIRRIEKTLKLRLEARSVPNTLQTTVVRDTTAGAMDEPAEATVRPERDTRPAAIAGDSEARNRNRVPSDRPFRPRPASKDRYSAPHRRHDFAPTGDAARRRDFGFSEEFAGRENKPAAARENKPAAAREARPAVSRDAKPAAGRKSYPRPSHNEAPASRFDRVNQHPFASTEPESPFRRSSGYAKRPSVGASASANPRFPHGGARPEFASDSNRFSRGSSSSAPRAEGRGESRTRWSANDRFSPEHGSTGFRGSDSRGGKANSQGMTPFRGGRGPAGAAKGKPSKGRFGFGPFDRNSK